MEDTYLADNRLPDTRQICVEVKPFVNQVGGHSCVLEIDDKTICKPYVEREVWFYRNVPPEMLEYIPRYYGEIDVIYDIINGNKRLIACIPENIMTKQSRDNLHKHLRQTDKERTKVLDRRGRKRCHDNIQSESGSQNKESKNKYNQWSVKCLERQITRYGFWANNQPQKFIMLGNLVSDYRHPCMMDLKLGRRQYGDDSSEEKRKLLEKRCAASTSSSLGFRICGTQMYRYDEGKYVTHDKYHGRYLDKDGVSNEVNFFFHNGISLRNDVISGIIGKLENLKTILSNEKTLNLFSCSLLLIYDGHISHAEAEVTSNIAGSDLRRETLTDPKSDSSVKINGAEMSNSESSISTDTKFDVRLIDFAHVSETGVISGNDQQTETNKGLVFGLTKLIEMLRDTAKTKSNEYMLLEKM